MADWSNSRRHDATDVHHASQDMGGFVRTPQIRQRRVRGIRLCPPSPISDITSVSGESAPWGHRIEQAPYGMPLWEVGLTSDGRGAHQDLRKPKFLALSDLVGHRDELRKRWYVPESDGREGGSLRQRDDPAYNLGKRASVGEERP